MHEDSPPDAPIRFALTLALFTVAWNVAEGLASIALGLAVESVALLGFGLDSWIEVASALIVRWRLRAELGVDASPRVARDRERRASRLISLLLLGLAASAALGALLQLGLGRAPETPLPGLVVAAVSLSFMFWLWRAKLRVAAEVGSRTLALDAACSRGCLELSAVLLAGSLLVGLHPGLWWADAAAALVIAALIGREGLAGWRAASAPEFSGGCGCGHGGP